jgi:hypothetical protein
MTANENAGVALLLWACIIETSIIHDITRA